MEASPNITVGILRNSKVNFILSGKYEVSEVETPLFGEFEASINGSSIVLSNSVLEFDFKNEAILVPCAITSDYFELKDVTIGIDFHWEQKENQKFQGALKLQIINNEIQVINIVPIENYLESVITSEMNANSSLNLLKAHAIISRSWLIAQMVKQEIISSKNANIKKPTVDLNKTDEFINWYDREDHHDFTICADDHCQRYQGITRSHHPNVIKAIQETIGQVLKYEDQVCDTRYSKSCGGISETYMNCWEPIEVPYLSKVIDREKIVNLDINLTVEQNAIEWINSNPEAFCNTKDEKVLSQVLNDYDVETENSYRWKVEYTQEELAQLIKKKSGIDFGKIEDLIPIKRGDSARLVKLKIVGKEKTLVIGKELEIRKWLSESHLYSSAFYIEKSDIVDGIPGKFILKGAGWGHGVGLCQIGAAVMGHKGYKFDEILNHYYLDAKIVKYY